MPLIGFVTTRDMAYEQGLKNYLFGPPALRFVPPNFPSFVFQVLPLKNHLFIVIKGPQCLNHIRRPSEVWGKKLNVILKGIVAL